jgi:hypothetical protein
MEFVGILPAPDHSLPSRWFHLFGVLATSEDSPRESETCHFCLADIARDERFVTETLCCGHLMHSACFGSWLFVSASENDNLTARCAYCRQDYVDMISVFSACVLSRPKNNSCKQVVAVQQHIQRVWICYVLRHWKWVNRFMLSVVAGPRYAHIKIERPVAMFKIGYTNYRLASRGV